MRHICVATHRENLPGSPEAQRYLHSRPIVLPDIVCRSSFTLELKSEVSPSSNSIVLRVAFEGRDSEDCRAARTSFMGVECKSDLGL